VTDSRVRDLPKNIEAEQVVLGSVLLEPDTSMPIIVGKLLPDHFYENRHRVIFSAMADMFDKGTPCGVILLANRLEELGDMGAAGGRMYLNELLDRTSTTASLGYYVDVVRNKFALRQIISAGERIEEIGHDERTDVLEVLAEANQLIGDVDIPEDKPPYIRLGDNVAMQIEVLEQIHNGSGGVVGVPSGYDDLDKYTSGFRDSDLIIIAARPGVGKCLGEGTPVLMFDGSVKNVEDVQTGDLLIGPDSNPRKVSGTTRGNGRLYKITPVKGKPYVVNEDHILSVKMSPSVKGEERYVENVSVLDYLSKNTRWKHHAKGWRCGVDWKETSVRIDPYILGIWLGDGSSGKPQVATADRPVVDALSNFAKGRGLVSKMAAVRGKANTYAVVKATRRGPRKNSFMDDLRCYGIYTNKSIPSDYLINNRHNRLEMLAGLLDSDGELSNGCYAITQKRKILSEQICFLARSLGLAAYMSTVRKKCCNNGVIGTYYSVIISGNTDEIPVRIAAKKALPRKMNKDVCMTGISVECIGEGKYFGFEVDHDGLFLLGDFTVTHNSSLITAITRRIALEGYKVGIFSLEMSSEQILQRLLCGDGRINLQKMRGGFMNAEDWRRLTDAAGKIQSEPIYIDDSPGNSLNDILTKARLMKERENIDIMFIDYLQLMEISGFVRNRENEVAKITRSLKKLARELNIPVVALSQLTQHPSCCAITVKQKYGRQVGQEQTPNPSGFARIWGNRARRRCSDLYLS